MDQAQTCQKCQSTKPGKIGSDIVFYCNECWLKCKNDNNDHENEFKTLMIKIGINNDSSINTLWKKVISAQNDIHLVDLEEQVKYMPDYSLRSLIQDKENIIENLMYRYENEFIKEDKNRKIATKTIIKDEYYTSIVNGLAQRTILENFELRELVNELRDENFHLRNEIYELQDKINRMIVSNGDNKPNINPKPAKTQLYMNNNEMIELKLKNIRYKEGNEYLAQIQQYLGLSLNQLIPAKLNDKYKKVYMRLFDGFCREFEKDNKLFMAIPSDIPLSISHYFPFWSLTVTAKFRTQNTFNTRPDNISNNQQQHIQQPNFPPRGGYRGHRGGLRGGGYRGHRGYPRRGSRGYSRGGFRGSRAGYRGNPRGGSRW